MFSNSSSVFGTDPCVFGGSSLVFVNMFDVNDVSDSARQYFPSSAIVLLCSALVLQCSTEFLLCSAVLVSVFGSISFASGSSSAVFCNSFH